MIIINNLNLRSLSESNLFLRALWANLRKRFGALGWQYSPRKIGKHQRIRFGWMSLGNVALTGVEVSIQYKQKGVIKAVEFNFNSDIVRTYPDIEEILRSCVSEALTYKDNLKETMLTTQVTSSPKIPLAYYRGRNWYCGPLSNGETEIGIKVKGFDDADFQYQFELQLTLLLNILACLTNTSFEKSFGRDGEPICDDISKNRFLDQHDWLDNYPLLNGHLAISVEQLRFCEDLIDGFIEDDRFARAASLFHKGLEIYRESSKGHDIAQALFISALEAIDLPNNKPTNCQECGQPQYKISQRIADLGEKYLGEAVKDIFKQAYSRRSSYLHAGKTVGSQPFLRHIIPQLDPGGIEGCAAPTAIITIKNLLEFTSFIIRKEILLWLDRSPSL